jgi:hypothetical protein
VYNACRIISEAFTVCGDCDIQARSSASPLRMLANFFRKFKKKKPEPPPRRDVVKGTSDFLASEEAVTKLTNAVAQNPPGTSLRWDKILELINHQVEPSEEVPDPLRVEVTREVLVEVLRDLYEHKRSILSDGLTLVKEFIPLMYDKHTFERGLKISQRERDQKGLTDECYAYGELDNEIFAAMFLRVISVYGEKPTKGSFYDLGCGVGMLVSTF